MPPWSAQGRRRRLFDSFQQLQQSAQKWVVKRITTMGHAHRTDLTYRICNVSIVYMHVVIHTEFWMQRHLFMNVQKIYTKYHKIILIMKHYLWILPLGCASINFLAVGFPKDSLNRRAFHRSVIGMGQNFRDAGNFPSVCKRNAFHTNVSIWVEQSYGVQYLERSLAHMLPDTFNVCRTSLSHRFSSKEC